MQTYNKEQKHVIKNFLEINDNLITIWVFYRLLVEYQGLIGYYICVLWNFREWMGIVDASFGVPRIKIF
jgi:hypothetical protein